MKSQLFLLLFFILNSNSISRLIHESNIILYIRNQQGGIYMSSGGLLSTVLGFGSSMYASKQQSKIEKENLKLQQETFKPHVWGI